MRRASRGALASAITAAITAAVTAAACAAPRQPAPEGYCPTIPEETNGAYLVHGARIADRNGETADVLVAGGEVVAIGRAICFRAVAGSVRFVDGQGATLLRPRGGSIEAGTPADGLVLESRDGEIVRRSRP